VTQPQIETLRPAAPPEFDPLSEAYLREPASVYVQAREEHPVFFSEQLQTWVMTRRASVWRYLDDRENFRSSLPGPASVHVPEEFAPHFTPGLLPHKMMPFMDPPEHTGPKKAVQQGFLRPQIIRLEGRIAENANTLIDGFAGAGECELMSSYSNALTMRTLLHLLGLQESDAPRIWSLGESAIRVLASTALPMAEPELSEVWRTYTEGQLWLRGLAEERAENPGEDIISIMAGARDETGAPVLTPERVALHASEVAFAGHDTTAQLMTNMTVHLSQNPAQLELVQQDPKLWANVVEETLRRRPSAPFAQRIAVRDVEVDGVTLPAGSVVWFALVSASNDPTHYDDPDRFDVQRPRAMDHLAFSRGAHTCPGAPLGRVQARVGVQTLFERLPDLTVVPDQPLDFAPLVILPKRNSLRVRFTPTSGN
jgi:cytochrome P450